MVTMKIAVLGAGAFGTALGGVLADNGYDVDYYDPQIECEKLSDVVDGAKCIVMCVPSTAAPHVLPHLPHDIPLIVATKGILCDDMFDGFSDYMVLSGPGFAADIKMAKPTKLTATDDRIVELFGNEFLSFDRTSDRRGVLMCGALKNIYAILAGYLELEPGTKAHEEFLTEVAEEMQALLSANGADPNTVNLVCGKGDLRLTCDYPSRNYAYGRKLRREPGCVPNNTVEGLLTLKRIARGEIKVPDEAKYLHKIMEVYKNGIKC